MTVCTVYNITALVIDQETDGQLGTSSPNVGINSVDVCYSTSLVDIDRFKTSRVVSQRMCVEIDN